MKVKVKKVNRKAVNCKALHIDSEKAVKHLEELKKAIENSKLEAAPNLENHVTVITEQKTLGERLKYVRKTNKLSQVDFAKPLGISQTHVSKIEKDVERPSETLLILISYLFGINITWLKEGTGLPNVFNGGSTK